MDVEALIAGVGELLRLPALRLNEQGVCRLAVDNDLIVDIEHDGAANVLHIYSSLGPLPAGGREAVYEALLAGNLFGAETGGGALAVDLAAKEIVLCRSLSPKGLEPSDLVAVIEAHVAAVEHWRGQVAGLSAGAGASALPPDRVDGFPQVGGIRA